MQDYEKLGAFYLGKLIDSADNSITEQLLLYDSKDLTTHAVCIGMTGSGKTGLCISLLEEAAMDNIPAIIIDPKGDMTNLLLTFPELSPQDFLPWVNETEAQKKQLSTEAFAQKLATQWREGLKQWDQDGERIAVLRSKVEFNIYTPGSSAGLPVSILKSFSAPSAAVMDDEDSLNERVSSTVGSLLGLLGINADPVKSREHILLSTIFRHFWGSGKDIDLAQLIQAVQSPPVTKVGVFDMDTFYAPKDRFELAMSLNNFLAAPGFSAWLQGADLSPDSLLYSPTGKPRMSIMYIAHLSDQERMFFVSLLLNQVVSWMRSQAGTASLRMILYFDEIFGYLPPLGEPPSKKPLMTLLKQGRAFGIGTVLATQNPVDLDYKALSNTGTWFIGRLQTERDRDRVLDGLGSLSAGQAALSRSDLSRLITNLEKRQFLMHNVHEKGPVIFNSRWAMSYLYGPLTREQIKKLVVERPAPEKKAPTASTAEVSARPPALPPELRPLYVPANRLPAGDARRVYPPYLWGRAKLTFLDKAKGLDVQTEVRRLTPILDAVLPVDWNNAVDASCRENDLSATPLADADYTAVPPAARTVKNYTEWKNGFKEYLFAEEKLTLFKSPEFKENSAPGESERDFRVRLSHKARVERDKRVEALRLDYEKKIAALESRLLRAEDRLEREKAQARRQKLDTAISLGATVLGAFMGRKTGLSTVSRAGTAMRSAGRTIKESSDVGRAEQEYETIKEQLDALQQELQQKVDALPEKTDGSDLQLETATVRPTKTQIMPQLVTFVWAPFIRQSNGAMTPAF